MTNLPIHIDLEGYNVEDNCLVIGGRKLTDIKAETSQEPLYIYDSKLIQKRIEALRSVLPDGVQLHYAIKANPMPELVQFIAQHVDGLDVASAGELKIALRTEIPREDISFAGPAKRDFELREAIAAGITVNVESFNEFERLTAITQEAGTRAKIAIRVNPDFELKSSGMKMSGGPKPFGVDAEEVAKLLQKINLENFSFQGLHIFSGSQNLSAESIIEAQRKTIDLALKLAEFAPSEPRFVNIGGGFGIPYFPGDKQLDVAEIGKALLVPLGNLKTRLPDTDVVIELGRYIVGEAGIYVCEIIDKKQSRGTTYLLTNGGLHHHLSASGNFGQVIRKNYPLVIGNRIWSEEMETVNIVGPLCTPLDVLGDKMNLPMAEPGDLVVVFQSGAYGLSASPQEFLGHPKSAEIII